MGVGVSSRTLARFKRNLPAVYASNSTMQLMAAAVAAEWDLVYDALYQIQAQAFVLSATWGIQYWEALLALPSNNQLSLGARRAAVLAVLQPAGPVTLNAIKRFVAQFPNGTVDVQYVPQLWQISISFQDIRGLPPQLTQIQSGLDALVPAWLSLAYKFHFTTYGELKGWGLTYGQIKALGLTYGQLKTWAPSGAGASQANSAAATMAQGSGGIVAQPNSAAATLAASPVTVTPSGGH